MDVTHPLEDAPYLADIAQGPEGGRAYWLRTQDGTRIRLGVWPDGPKGTILMFPGRTEYIEKYGRVAKDMAARGFGMIAMDWRGQGLADRPAHNRDMGHVTSFDEYRQDVAAMRAALEQINPPKPWFMIGHSMGGAIGLRAIYDGLPLSAVAFSAPMWGIQLSPLAQFGSNFIRHLSRPLGMDAKFAPSTGPSKIMEFEGNPLTHDREQFDYMWDQVRAYPDLALGGPSTRWLICALDETASLMEMPAPDLPALTYLGTNERIVRADRIKTRMTTWKDGLLELVEGGKHEMLMEGPAMREPMLDGIAAWFSKHS